MFQWKINKSAALAIFAFGMILPEGMASAGIYYGVRHHGGDDGHEAYEGHSYMLYRHSYYSSYPHEIRIYSHQQNASIVRSGDSWALLKSNHPDEALNTFALEAPKN